MNWSQKSITTLLALMVSLTGCNSQRHLNSGLGGGLLAGIGGQLDAAPRAQKMRLRDSDKGKVFEYSDPRSTNEKWIQIATVEILPKGTQYYHWGPAQDVQHWVKSGITKDEIDRAIRSVDENDLLGGGFYISSDPVDSSRYGTNQIVVEPRHDVVSLVLINANYRFNHDDQTLTDNATGVALYVPDIAAAGIETLRYSGTWMVTIQATVLENLFETSWSNFLLHMKNGPSALTTLAQFSAKYTLTKQVLERPDFQQLFPTVIKAFKQEALSPQEKQDIIDAYKSTTWPSDFSVATVGEIWPKIMSESFNEERAKFFAQFKAANQQGDFETYSDALVGLRENGLDIRAVARELGVEMLLNPDLDYSGPLGSGLIEKDMDDRLVDGLSATNIYEILQNALTGAKDVDGLLGIKKGQLSVPEKIVELVHSQSDRSDSIEFFEKLPTVFGSKASPWRDQPLMATGDYLLDGNGQPGYIKVSSFQKEVLEKNPFLVAVFKEQMDPQGQKQFYVRYAYPSAANYRNFVNYIADQGLLQKLAAAEKNGELKDTSTAVFKNLTAATLKEVARNVMKARGRNVAGIALDFFRICPFADLQTTLKYLNAKFFVTGNDSFFFLNPDWARTATLFEVNQLVEKSTLTFHNFTFSLVPPSGSARGDKPIDLDYDIGYWEIASNRPRPHKDNFKFVQKLKGRFSSAEVQSWMKNKNYSKVYQALHEAGAE